MNSKEVVHAIYWFQWLQDAEEYVSRTRGEYFSLDNAVRLELMAQQIRSKIAQDKKEETR